ncbi:MAG: carboxypeptidase-like regulatory domain-containing protein [Kofleriaceae bacterium]
MALAVRLALVATALGAGGCGSPRRSALQPAGSKADDGHGILAQASIQLMTRDDPKPASDEAEESEREQRDIRMTLEEYETEDTGPDGAGSGSDGDTHYEHYRVPQWRPVMRTPPAGRIARQGLTGAVEGTVHWRGALPQRVTTPCGAVDQVNVGADRAVAGVVIYIEPLRTVRAIPYDGDDERGPPSIGGAIVKRGCTLMPSLQPINPTPAAVTIQGDATRAALAVRGRNGERQIDLHPGGRVVLAVAAGMTSVHDLANNGVTPAWVVGIDSPYYAVTDDRGRYRIDELPAGTHRVTIVQPPIIRIAGDGKPMFGEPAVTHRSVTIDAKRPSRLDVTIELPPIR